MKLTHLLLGGPVPNQGLGTPALKEYQPQGQGDIQQLNSIYDNFVSLERQTKANQSPTKILVRVAHIEIRVCLCNRVGGEGRTAPLNVQENHSPQINQERVLQPLHDLELLEDIPYFVALHALLFVHVLHRIHLFGIILLHNADLMVPTGVRM